MVDTVDAEPPIYRVRRAASGSQQAINRLHLSILRPPPSALCPLASGQLLSFERLRAAAAVHQTFVILLSDQFETPSHKHFIDKTK